MSGSFKFVLYFLICFLGLNIGYQFLLYLSGNQIDFFTAYIAQITAQLYGLPTQLNPLKPGIQILFNNTPIVNIMEGCNGLAVWFTLLSFISAFGGKKQTYVWYIPMSFILLESGNIIRLLALIAIKINYPTYFEFFHTYAFPAILYAFAFGLMLVWIQLQSRKPNENTD